MSKQLNARLCVIEGCSRKVQRAARICCYCRKQYSRDHTPYKFKSGLVSGRLLKPYNTVTPATKRYRLRQIDNDLAWFGGSDAGFDQLLLDFQKRHPAKGCELSEEQDMHIIAGRNIIDYCRHSCYRSHERKQIERIIVRDAPVRAMAIALQRSEPYIRTLKKTGYVDTKLTSVNGRKVNWI